MGRIIAVANQKGGVGKTSTVMNLGAALAERGHRTLLIDLDPQGSLTAMAGADPYSPGLKVHDLLLEPNGRWTEMLHQVDKRLWLAPAGVQMTAGDYKLVGFGDRTLRLKRALSSIQDTLPFVLIDTPPSLGLLTMNALMAAEEVLVPVEAKYLAMRGIRALLETVWMVHENYHPRLRVLGILPTRYHPESPHSKKVVSEIRRVFKERVFEVVIPYDEAVANAPAARRSVLSYSPDSAAARSYRELADQVLSRGPGEPSGAAAQSAMR